MSTEPPEIITPAPISPAPEPPEGPLPPAQPGNRKADPHRKESRTSWLKRAVLANAYSPNPLLLKDLAVKLGVSAGYVTVVAHRLRKEGKLGPRGLPPVDLKPVAKVIITDSREDPPVAAIEATEIMDETEALRRLSWTARYGAPSLQQDAQKRIIDLARASGESAGPREPLAGQRPARLAILMLICGPTETREAIEIAWPKRGRPPKDPVLPSSVPSDATPLPEEPADGPK